MVVHMKKHKGRGPIARKVISTARQQLQRKVVDFSAWKDAKIMSREYQESIISDDKLSFCTIATDFCKFVDLERMGNPNRKEAYYALMKYGLNIYRNNRE